MYISFGVSLFLTSAIVGALKTALVLRYLLAPMPVTVPVTALVMVVATALTFAVLSFAVNLLTPTDRRPKSAGTGVDGAPSKERIVAACAAEWGLSEAETDVALFVVKGFSNAEIAELRGCAVGTVKAQLGALFRKSGLENRVQLIALVSDEMCEQALDFASSSKPGPAEAPAEARGAGWAGKRPTSADFGLPVGAARLAATSEALE